MSCLSCENGGYRKLCFYDPYHDTCQGILKPDSFACVAKGYGVGDDKHCVRQKRTPGPGSYSSMDECQKNCKDPGPLGQYRFRCVGRGYGSSHRSCIRENGPPGPGTFSNVSACQKRCGPMSGPTTNSFYGY